jgi:hypothetical protein
MAMRPHHKGHTFTPCQHSWAQAFSLYKSLSYAPRVRLQSPNVHSSTSSEIRTGSQAWA